MTPPSKTPTVLELDLPDLTATAKRLSGLFSRDMETTTENPSFQYGDDIRCWLPNVEIRSPAIRQSNIGTYRGCRRWFLFSQRLGLVRPSYPRAATIGTLFHKMVETLYSGDGSWDQACMAVANTLMASGNLLQDWVDNHGGDPTILQAQLDSQEKDAALAKAMAHYFLVTYPRDPRWETVAVEADIEVQVQSGVSPGITAPIAGRIDRLIYDPGLLLKDTPGYWLVDYKTLDGKRPTRPYARALKFSTQKSLYRLLATAWLQKMDRPEPLLGCVYCLMARPGISFGSYDRDFAEETRPLKSGPRRGQMVTEKTYFGAPLLDYYIERCRRWLMAEGEFSKHLIARTENPVTMRPTFPFTGKLVDGELANVLYEQSRACRAAPLLSTYYRDAGHCVLRSGKPCPYLALCESDPELWAGIVEAEHLIVGEDPKDPKDPEEPMETPDE